MNNGKSPGTDGFPAEFLKFFQKTERGNFEVRAINEGFHKGEMFPSHKEGIITCIPKGDKPREHLKILHILMQIQNKNFMYVGHSFEIYVDK